MTTDSKPFLRLGIPAGSLQKATVELFAKAGFDISDSKRSYLPTIDDDEIQLTCLRAQEMGRYVSDGVLDAGITGFDWIKENQCNVVEVCELAYSKATSNPTRWVLAVPNESKIHRPEDLDGAVVATELVNVTRQYFAQKNVNVRVEFSWGATEVKVPELADAIAGTSANTNAVDFLDPNADLPTAIAKLNELILTMRR